MMIFKNFRDPLIEDGESIHLDDPDVSQEGFL